MASTISDMTNSTSLDGLLKDVYLPGLTETVFNDTDFTALIQKMTPADITFEGQRVKHAFESQRAAGVGPITEGGDFVDAVPVKGKQGAETLKYLNCYIELTGPLIATAATDRASFVNAVTRHFQTNMIAAKNDLERQIMGRADCYLGEVNDATPTGTSLTVTGPAFFDTQFIEPGMYVEFRDPTYGAATLRTSINASAVNYAIISSITKGNKTTSTGGTITLTEAITGTVADDDWIVRYNSWNSGGTSAYEINGLKNLVSDGTNNSETSANYTSVWGITRTTAGYEYLQSYMKDLSDEIDEDNLLDIMIMLQTQYQGRPNLLLVSPRAMRKYFTNSVSANRRFNVLDAIDWTGGYKGLGVQLGTTKLMLTAVASVPYGYAYMLNTNDFAFTTASNGYQWILGDGNNVLQQSHTADKKFASAVNYLQFVCFDPGRQCKIYNVTEV